MRGGWTLTEENRFVLREWEKTRRERMQQRESGKNVGFTQLYHVIVECF